MEWLEVEPHKALSLYEFAKGYREITDAHTVDFFTEHHWENVIPEKWRDDLLSIDDVSVFLQPEKMKRSVLKEFLCEAKQLKLPLRSRDDDDSNDGDFDAASVSSPIDRFGMTEKKAHEVKRMAAQISSIVNQVGIHQVVDVGSGKGYLSEYLSFNYGLRVYGIDSSSVNKEGALDRSRKVEKYFGLHRAIGQDRSSPTLVTGDSESQTHLLETVDKTERQVDERLCPTLLPSICSDGCGNSCNGDNDKPVRSDGRGLHDNYEPGFFKPLTHCIKHSDDVLALIQQNSDGQSYKTSVHCRDNGDRLQPSILVGLHACGDLSAIGLRQFVRTELLKAVCIVGCCYHHITETGDCPGFPMSDFLKSKCALLGRKALMLSCQSEGRFVSVTSGNSLLSVFYRAVLQVVLRDEMKIFKTREEALSLCVGRIKKYATFVEYCRKAMKKLHIPIGTQPTDEVLESFHQLYLPSLVKVQRYLQIRAVIAPVIESLIVADRFLYLKERKDVKRVWMTQLFSSTISPRCIGLCAYK